MPAEFEAARRKAHDALEAGDLDGADRILAELDTRHVRWLAEQDEMLDQGKRYRGRNLSQRAEIALMRLEHLHAAKLYGEVADAYPQSDREKRCQRLSRRRPPLGAPRRRPGAMGHDPEQSRQCAGGARRPDSQ